MGVVKLIGAPTSLYCTRVEWALKMKGVEYEHLEENVRNKSPLLLKYNPVHKKIPVLLHDDKPIAESLVILEYIDETWKESPLLPEDPYQKARARFWAKFADEKCLRVTWEACNAEGEAKEKAVESALESFAFLEKQIEGRKFFSGEEIGFLDLSIGSMIPSLNVVEEIGGFKLLDKFPSLSEWSQNFHQIPLIKESLPPREKLVDYFTTSVNYIRSLAAKKD